MLIYLIRHGRSMGNIMSDTKGIIHGRGDQSILSKEGRRQIYKIGRSLAWQLQGGKFDLWYSPNKRTKESTAILRRIMKPDKDTCSKLLYDIDFGNFENKKWSDIRIKYSGWLTSFRKDRLNTSYPGGESLGQLHQRVAKFIKENLDHSSIKHHLIVAHEEIIRAFLSYFSKNKLHYHSRVFSVPNGSVSIISYDKSQGIIINVGKTDISEIFDESKLQLAYKWYLKDNTPPDEFLPRKNYSENHVFTAIRENKRETIKLVPVKLRDDMEKDIHIGEEVTKLGFVVPHVSSLTKKGNFVCLHRSYVEGNTAENLLQNTRYRKQVSKLMGCALRSLHSISLNRLDLFIHTPKTWSTFIQKWINNDLKILKHVDKNQSEVVGKVYSSFIKRYMSSNITFLHNDLSAMNIAIKKEQGKLIFAGLWDFERSFTGDPLWDLGVTQKISFLRRGRIFRKLLHSYFQCARVSAKLRSTINLYTLMNTTGAIRYRYERNKDTREEQNNLRFVLKELIN